MWAALIEGALSLDQLREFARQYGIIPLHNHNYHGRLYVSCPDPRWRSRIAEVCYEEGTGWLYAGGRAPLEALFELRRGAGACRRRDVGAGLYPGGGDVPLLLQRDLRPLVPGRRLGAHAGRRGDGARNLLQDRGGLPGQSRLDDQAVAFWIVHDTADTDHSNLGRELLDQFAPSDAEREQVLATVKRHMASPSTSTTRSTRQSTAWPRNPTRDRGKPMKFRIEYCVA